MHVYIAAYKGEVQLGVCVRRHIRDVGEVWACADISFPSALSAYERSLNGRMEISLDKWQKVLETEEVQEVFSCSTHTHI